MRRGRVGRTRGMYTGTSLFSLVLALAAGRPVFTEREYTVVAGAVVDIFDLSDQTRTHVVTQADPAKQVAAPVAHADFGGARCYTFTGAQFYVSNRAASEWAFGNDGSGFSLFAVLTPTNVGAASFTFCRTNEGDSASGFGFYVQSSAYRSNARNASAQSLWSDRSQGAAAAGTPSFVEISHGTARSPQFDLRLKGTTSSSGSYANAAAAGDPASTLTWGSRPSGAADKFQGRTTALIFTPGVSASERTAVHQAIFSFYRIAA